MTAKITDLATARQEKRQRTGWTLAEIRARAAQERAQYKKLAQNEPDNRASGGDMKQILEEHDDE